MCLGTLNGVALAGICTEEEADCGVDIATSDHDGQATVKRPNGVALENTARIA